MLQNLLVPLLCLLMLGIGGCRKAATMQPSSSAQATASPATQQQGEAYFDVCGLIKREEIEAVQGSPVKDTKSSCRSDGSFRVSLCFYSTDQFSNSVSLAVTQRDPAINRSPRDFWKETFSRYEGEAKEQESDKKKAESVREQRRVTGEEEQSVPPKKIDSVGDEAYWLGNRVGGALYVLKKDAFIRVSVGGADNEETKIEKSKKLAQKAIDRL
jgi:hypothetical protein